jgi:hypothetical protein
MSFTAPEQQHIGQALLAALRAAENPPPAESAPPMAGFPQHWPGGQYSVLLDQGHQLVTITGHVFVQKDVRRRTEEG